MSIVLKGLLFIGAGAVAQLAIIAVFLGLQQSLERELQSGEYQQKVFLHLNQLQRIWQESTMEHIKHCTMGLRITSRKQSALFQGAKDETAVLSDLLAAEPACKKEMDEIRSLIEETFPLLEEIRNARADQQGARVVIIFARLARLSNLSTTGINHLLDEFQSRIEISTGKQAKLRDELRLALIFGFFINLAIAVISAFVFFRTVGKRLHILGENTMRLAANQPVIPIGGTGDEIARANSSLLAMAKELKAANSQRLNIMEKAKDLICSITLNGTFIDVNSASLSMLGYAQEELTGARLLKLVDDGDKERAMSMFRKAANGEVVKPFDVQMKCKDGQALFLSWSINRPLEQEMLLCVAHDVTEKKELEQLKQEFLLMVSHDLRSPLSNVHGVLTLLDEGVIRQETDRGKQQIKASLHNVDRLMRLITDLLDIQKMEEGKLELVRVSCPAQEIVEDSVRSVANLAELKDVAIITEAKADINLIADKDRLIQVLVNLLSNAIKFSPREGTIHLNLRIEDSFVRFSVIDEGPGIPEDKAQQLFERFSQTQKAHGKKGQGFGLGLAIAREIVHLHGGGIGALPASPVGSEFWFQIPIDGAD